MSYKERDPQTLPVDQLIKMPFHYRELLRKRAEEEKTTVPSLMLDAIQRRIPPTYKSSKTEQS